jgi:hypothetical protein
MDHALQEGEPALLPPLQMGDADQAAKASGHGHSLRATNTSAAKS